MRHAVIWISRGVNLAGGLGSTGMRGAVIEKTLKNETNVGFARSGLLVSVKRLSWTVPHINRIVC